MELDNSTEATSQLDAFDEVLFPSVPQCLKNGAVPSNVLAGREDLNEILHVQMPGIS